MKFLVRAPLALLAMAMLSAWPLVAEESKPVQWSVTLSRPAVAVGEEIDVIFRATIAAHWIVYSSDFKAEMGPQPTQFRFEATDSFRPVGETASVNPRRKKDQTWDTEFGYFAAHAEFRQRIKVLKLDPADCGPDQGTALQRARRHLHTVRARLQTLT